MSEGLKFAVLAVLSAALLALACTVWPTAWRYEKYRTGGVERIARTHRLDGRVQYLDGFGRGWVDAKQKQ